MINTFNVTRCGAFWIGENKNRFMFDDYRDYFMNFDSGEIYIMMRQIDDDNVILMVSKYQDKVAELRKNGEDVKKILACIFDLYEEHEIDEEEEAFLYMIADPDEEFNCPGEYWMDMTYDNMLL